MTPKTALVSFLIIGVLAQPLVFPGGYVQGETNNFQVSVGTSTRASQFDDFAFGRMGLVFHNGRLFPVWPDNSTVLGGNPDIPNFDVATVPISVSSDGTIALGTRVNVSRALGNQQGVTVALSPINPNNVVIVSNGAPGVTAPPTQFLGSQPLATVGPNVTSFSDDGHAPQTLLVYRVRVINASGSSPYSNELGVTTLALPATAPTNLAVTSFTSAQIELRWADNSANKQGFVVERSADGMNFSELGFRLSANSTTFTDQGLPVGTTFFYRVRAFNTAGKSTSTNVAGGTTDGPSALFIAAVSRSRISLRWTDNSDRESNYRIERSRDGLSYTEIAAVGPNVTTFLDTSLRSNTLYSYRVRGTMGGVNSGYTNYSFTTTFK